MCGLSRSAVRRSDASFCRKQRRLGRPNSSCDDLVGRVPCAVGNSAPAFFRLLLQAARNSGLVNRRNSRWPGPKSMADIFVSYSKQDRVLALELSSWLVAQGWTTWRDKTVLSGETRDENVRELNQARAVIVLWSVASVGSPHVLHEAIAARDAKKLLHVKVSGLDRQRIPVSLRNQAVLEADDLPSIGRAIAGIVGSRPAVRHLQLGDSLAAAGPRRDPERGLAITRRTRETAQETIGLRASQQRARQQRAALLAIGATCLATLAVVVLFGNALTDALPILQSGLTKLLAFLN